LSVVSHISHAVYRYMPCLSHFHCGYPIFGEVCRVWIFPVHSFLLCPIAPFQPVVRRPWAVFMAVIEWLIGITSNLQFYITIITIRTLMHYFHNFVSNFQRKRFFKSGLLWTRDR
jgi:hypothetical protein